jgi:hypothetical protein
LDNAFIYVGLPRAVGRSINNNPLEILGELEVHNRYAIDIHRGNNIGLIASLSTDALLAGVYKAGLEQRGYDVVPFQVVATGVRSWNVYTLDELFAVDRIYVVTDTSSSDKHSTGALVHRRLWMIYRW